MLQLVLLLLLQASVVDGYDGGGGGAFHHRAGGGRHRRRHADHKSSSSPVVAMQEEVRRQLAGKSVTEFCSDLQALENYVTVKFQDLFGGADILLLSGAGANGQFVCSCTYNEDADNNDGALHVECGSFHSLDGEKWTTVDYMTLKPNGEDGTYIPASAGWCDYLDGNVGPTYCEDYALKSNDPTQLDSCTVMDGTCEGTTTCQVCQDGQSVSIIQPSNACYFEPLNCADNYQGSFLYQYQLGNPVQVETDCPADASNLPTQQAFCDDLANIEATITTELWLLFADASELGPYSCECVSAAAGAFTLNCEATYTWIDGSIFLNTEQMTFEEQVPNSGLFIPSKMKWCDKNTSIPGDGYCESYEFAVGQKQLSVCNLGDCEAKFCELCPNGLTFSDTCRFEQHCRVDEGNTGAFLFRFKDVQVAGPSSSTSTNGKCDPTKPPATKSPAAAPPPPATKAPTVVVESAAFGFNFLYGFLCTALVLTASILL